ncbi:MAG TPA: lysophospholipid acyltransferase family protein [Gemmatimonadaceae bacterium]|nr:lysophospholipid acyltransferase family protein [Gemmatimonadaceae bacterium]
MSAAARDAAHPTLAHRAEYYAVRAAVGALDTLSWRRAGDLGARLGALGYRPFGIRRAVVERQIAAAFPEMSREQVLRTARASYEHLGRTFVEAALLPSFDRARVISLFSGADNWHLLENAIAAGRGVIVVTGHLGNWELAGAYVAARGVPVEAIARGMANPLFDAYVTRTRSAIGMRIVHDSDAVRRVPRAIREGNCVAFLSDQGVLGLASTFVPFFGMPAKTPRGPAVFALRLKVPVLFGITIREPDGRYRLFFEEVPVVETGDRERDTDAIVAAYTATLERYVRRAPEQYFWQHRRWRRQPADTPPELRDPTR